MPVAWLASNSLSSLLLAEDKAFNARNVEELEGLTFSIRPGTMFSTALAFPALAEGRTDFDGTKSRSLRVSPRAKVI